MEVREHIAALRRDGTLLAAAASNAELEVPIPTCPEWTMRDLLRHICGVHRWAATYVSQGRSAPMSEEEENELFARGPEGPALVECFRDGHAALVRALETADPGIACWSFLPAPTPLAFWARRQAHETGVHRADAECACGAVTPFPPDFAADGIDELLFAFVSRPGGRLRTDSPRTINVQATDIDRAWSVQIAPDAVVVRDGSVEEDCRVEGAASDLYLLLWNRRSSDGLAVTGDETLLDLWRKKVTIRWR